MTYTINTKSNIPHLMLSRIADSLYWLSRYMERAESMIRLTHVHYTFSLDKDIYGKTWRPVLETYSWMPWNQIEFIENDTQAALQNLLLDETNNNSLKVLLNKARENARGVQDHITKEVWREINQMYHFINDGTLHERLNLNDSMKVIETLLQNCFLYSGVSDTTMSRGTGWDFTNLGKYVERCLQTIVITEKQLSSMDFNDDANDILKWRYLLLSLSGYELHLKTYRTSNYNYNVLHQVVLNNCFTRSIIYSLDHVNIYLKRVINQNDSESTQLLNFFGRLHSKVKYVDLEILNSQKVEQFLNEIKKDLFLFCKLLSEHFFSYS